MGATLVSRPRGLVALALLALVVGAGSASADSWPGPRVFAVFSESGGYFARFVPGDSVGDTAGFAGAPRGRYAAALLYGLQADRSYKLLHEIGLPHPVSPVSALVSDEGFVITFDNWHNLGVGKVVVIHGPDGRLVRSYELAELYPPARLGKIRQSVSSRAWRCQPVHFVEPAEQKSVYVPEVLGGYFVFGLASGGMTYVEGGRRDCGGAEPRAPREGRADSVSPAGPSRLREVPRLGARTPVSSARRTARGGRALPP